MMKTIMAVIGLGLAGLFAFVLLALILAVPTWLLWNWLMPIIFGLKEITIFQAWGIMVLSNILFKTSITKKGD